MASFMDQMYFNSPPCFLEMAEKGNIRSSVKAFCYTNNLENRRKKFEPLPSEKKLSQSQEKAVC